MMPKVSVLMPVYNTPEKILRATIDSILNQTFADFELIIADDSPDPEETGKIVKSYPDKRIRYYTNEVNLGISGTRNRLLELSEGEYLAICDHDDISVPDRFEREVSFLDGRPDVGVVSGMLHCMHSGIVSAHPVSNEDIKAALLIQGCVIAHPASMIRKKVLTGNGIRWDENFSPCEDYKLWIDLIDKTLFHNIDAVLLDYRDSEDNTTHKQNEKMEEKARRIKSDAQKKHDWILEECVWQKRVYLLGIPFFKIVRTKKTTSFFLFDVIPVLKTKIRRKIK